VSVTGFWYPPRKWSGELERISRLRQVGAAIGLALALSSTVVFSVYHLHLSLWLKDAGSPLHPPTTPVGGGVFVLGKVALVVICWLYVVGTGRLTWVWVVVCVLVALEPLTWHMPARVPDLPFGSAFNCLFLSSPVGLILQTWIAVRARKPVERGL
jgi:hypothetical protein